MNIRKRKWLIISGYNPRKENVSYFILVKGFNSQMSEMHMKDFCDLYDLENLI